MEGDSDLELAVALWLGSGVCISARSEFDSVDFSVTEFWRETGSGMVKRCSMKTEECTPIWKSKLERYIGLVIIQ